MNRTLVLVLTCLFTLVGSSMDWERLGSRKVRDLDHPPPQPVVLLPVPEIKQTVPDRLQALSRLLWESRQRLQITDAITWCCPDWNPYRQEQRREPGDTWRWSRHILDAHYQYRVEVSLIVATGFHESHWTSRRARGGGHDWGPLQVHCPSEHCETWDGSHLLDPYEGIMAGTDVLAKKRSRCVEYAGAYPGWSRLCSDDWMRHYNPGSPMHAKRVRRKQALVRMRSLGII